MFAFWPKQRRRTNLLEQPFPDSWEPIVQQNVYHFHRFTDEQRDKVRRDLRIYVAEKNWEGCGGLEINDEIKVTIAAQMAILVLGFKEQYFDAVRSILVYPDAYMAKGQHLMEGGLVVEGPSAREGEAWYRGPVILSWADVLESGRGASRGHNLVFHEFAHQLDMLNGRVADGLPPLESSDDMARWEALATTTHNQLRQACSEGYRMVFDCYGATNMAEFFAVATETFFENPREFEEHHPELYGLFTRYYRQDPLSWDS